MHAAVVNIYWGIAANAIAKGAARRRSLLMEAAEHLYFGIFLVLRIYMAST